MNFLMVVLVVFGGLTIVGGGLIFYVYTKARSGFRSVFGNASLEDVMELTKVQESETPKSISGIESLVRKRIESDFKSMSIEELKSQNLDEIYAYYNAIETGDATHFENNKHVNDTIEKISKEYRKNDIHISKVYVHRHAISNYKKGNDTASISIQAALEYMKTENRNSQKIQARVHTEWIYTLDDANFEFGATATLNCPNCAAPVKNTKDKVCYYCGSNIEIDYTRAWRLHRISEHV